VYSDQHKNKVTNKKEVFILLWKNGSCLSYLRNYGSRIPVFGHTCHTAFGSVCVLYQLQSVNVHALDYGLIILKCLNFLSLLSCSPTGVFFDGSFCIHMITNSSNSDYECYLFFECGAGYVPLFWIKLLYPLSEFLADIGQICWEHLWWWPCFGMRFFTMLQDNSKILAPLWNFSVPYIRR
jgi:hypothetical protein